MDKQQIEILGRQRLIEQLIRSGVEVAMPIRDRGTDLIAYVERDDVDGRGTGASFAAVPIQMKSAIHRSFCVHTKYRRTSSLLLVYVWHVREGVPSEFFALDYPEACDIARTQGWTHTKSWAKGGYTTTRPSQELVERLQAFRMDGPSWRAKVRAVARRQAAG